MQADSAQPEASSAWQTLLSQCSSLSGPDVDDTYILQSLNTLHKKLFSSRTLAFVTDIGNRQLPEETADEDVQSSWGKTVTCDTQSGLQTCIDGKRSALRLISIVRGNSLQPFRISSEGIIAIINRHQIERPFLDLLLGFRSQSELSEKGCSLWCSSSNHDRSLICYQIRYRERNFRDSTFEGWSERQVGVYHEISHDQLKPSTIIVAHAKDKTAARLRLEKKMESSKSNDGHLGFNFELHLILLSSYVDSWRWYLDELGLAILADENKGVTEDLIHPYTISFPSLQKLRDTEADLATASVNLKSTIRVVEAIRTVTSAVLTKEMQAAAEDLPEKFGRIILRCEAYQAGIEVLSERVSKLIQLVADGLNHKNQINNANISTSLYQLTKKSIDDNTVIRVVTVITLIYLPTQFVATFFGMNFTNFQNSALVFAGNWWWFVAAAFPLTLITLAAVGIAMLVEQNKRQNRPPLSISGLLKRKDTVSLLPVKTG